MSIRKLRWAYVSCPLPFDALLSHHNWKVACGENTWPVSKAVRQAIYRRDNGKCYYCGSTERLTLDHRVPQSRGGSNHSDNLLAACLSCNTAKGAKHIRDFISHRFSGGAA